MRHHYAIPFWACLALAVGCGDDTPAMNGALTVTVSRTAPGCDENTFEDIGSIVIVAKNAENSEQSGCYSVRGIDAVDDLEQALKDSGASVEVSTTEGLELFIVGFDGAGCRSDERLLCGRSTSIDDTSIVIQSACAGGNDRGDFDACVAALPAAQ